MHGALRERGNNSLELDLDFNQTGSCWLIGASFSKAQKEEGKLIFKKGNLKYK